MYKWGHELCSLIYSWIKILIIKWPKTQTIDKFEQKKRKEKKRERNAILQSYCYMKFLLISECHTTVPIQKHKLMGGKNTTLQLIYNQR
jgi:hypothetical protein